MTTNGMPAGSNRASWRPSTASRTGPLLLGLVLVACADSGRSNSPVETADPWDLELVARIGSADGADDALSRIGQVLITSDSTLVISQTTSRLILMYDHQGRLLRQVGRRGEGPGEFSAIRAMGVLGDTLYVSDHALDRISYFDLAGEFAGSRRWTRQRLSFSDDYFFSTTPPQVLRADGSAVLQPSMGVTPTTAMGEGINTAIFRTPYFHVGVDSEIIDTVAWRETTEASVGVTRNGQDYFYPWPLATLPRAGILPDGTGVVVVEEGAHGESHEYRVVKLGLGGDTVFAASFAYVPKPVPQGHRDRQFGQVADRVRERDPDAPGSAEVRSAFASAGWTDESAVPVTGLALGQDGTVWLRREAGAPGSMVAWDVVDSTDGLLEGTVELPEGELVADAAHGHVATIGVGAFDVPTVSLYRLRR